jgi:hypothetical protein
MAQYRKKPVVIEAFQFRNGEQDGSVAADVVAGNVRYPEDGSMLIRTLEGEMRADPGDWIIRGVQGELYPCKPDIFAKTYEAVDTPEFIIGALTDAMLHGKGVIQTRIEPEEVYTTDRLDPTSHPD